MIMCLDVGNTQIHGGVFEGSRLRIQFRRQSKSGASSDEIGLFLRSVLRENGIQPEKIHRIAISTVVPEGLHSLKNACRKYFNCDPFVLKAGVRTGLRVKYRNPLEVGSDRIANAIAATELFPQKNLIVVDFGTATTFCAISKDKDYLGGTIIAGLRLSMQALEANTSKLPSVEIVVPEVAVGRSTVESIQAGLYFGTIGTVKEIVARAEQEHFANERPLVIGTGGLSSLFKSAKLFDHEVPDLVLKGLYFAYRMNH